jgi:predicted transcriptional regulator
VSAYNEKPTSFDRYVGMCLRASRMARGWTLGEAAERAGMSMVCLQSHETGRRSCPLETLVMLAEFYHAPVIDFMPVSEPVNDPVSLPPQSGGTKVRRRAAGTPRAGARRSARRPSAKPSS